MRRLWKGWRVWGAAVLMCLGGEIRMSAQSYGDTSVPGEPVLLLEGMLKDAYVEFFSEDPSNRPAIETAQFFKKNVMPIELQHLGRASILAEYRPQERKIVFNIVPLISKYTQTGDGSNIEWSESSRRSIMESWRQNPQSLRNFVERTAVVTVHEVSHARYDRAVAVSWNSVEEELACRSREVLFLRKLLRRRPGFLRLDAYDQLMRKFLGQAAAQGVWWQEPFRPPVAREEADRMAERIRSQFPGEFEDLSLEWYLVRLLNGGVPAFWEYLGNVLEKHYESLDQDWDAHFLKLRREMSRHEKRLKRAGSDSDKKRLRARIGNLRLHLEEEEAFRNNTDLVRAYRTYFDDENRRLKEELGREVLPETAVDLSTGIIPAGTRR